MDDANVIPFEPRRPPAPEPELQGVELRLDDDGSIEMTLHDDEGIAAILTLGVNVVWPVDFDLARLRAAWQTWRGSSTGVR